MQRGKWIFHSIDSSARASSVGGSVRPGALAVSRVDNQLDLDEQDRQTGRLLALENAAGVDAGLTGGVCKAASVARQATGSA
jgi:hypothetical protein